jgi:hypothetical protein
MSRFRHLPSRRIYKVRQQVELSFKRIKQQLQIKAPCGTSEGAVKTRIWIATPAYVLCATLRKRLALGVQPRPSHTESERGTFEKTPISQRLQPVESRDNKSNSANQVSLF